ncbi:MAG: glycosyltransferase family 2 protein [Elusimicrobiota bacterium]|jgi:GT2 family glycosyltransferase
MTMRVSAVLSTFRRAESLRRCLDSLRSQTRRPEQIVIIDAAGEDAVRALADSLRGDFKEVLYFHFPSSLTQARNHGIRSSSGDIVVFIDDDLVLEPEFIQELVSPLERDPGLAGVTGNIIGHPRGSEPFKQALKRFFMLPCDGDGRFRLSGAPTVPHGAAKPMDVEFLPGGLTAWRREVFSEFLFDESLPGLGINEDVDFSYRVSRKWRNFYTPKARCLHERPSLEREARWNYLAREYSSAWHLFKKNQPKDPLHSAAFLWQCVGLGVRFAFRRLGR